MKLLLTFRNVPGWAQPGFSSPSTLKPPSDCLVYSTSNTFCVSWKNFIYNVVNHAVSPTSSGGLGIPQSSLAIEIWNEPDNRNYWQGVCNASGSTNFTSLTYCPSPLYGLDEKTAAREEYVALLRATYDKLRTAFPGVTFVLGPPNNGTYYHYSNDTMQQSVQNWIGDLYANDNVGSYVNTVAIHMYPDYSSSSCPTVSDTFQPAGDVASIMAAHGDGAKPIWLTEFAWSITQDTNGNYLFCTPSQQSKDLSTALSYSHLPGNASMAFWWLTDRKYFGGTCNTTWVCGTALPTDRLRVPTTTPNAYTTLKNAP
jgi:hypothetical protein